MKTITITASPLQLLIAAMVAAVVLILCISFGATLCKWTIADTCERFGGFAFHGTEYACRINPPQPDVLP